MSHAGLNKWVVVSPGVHACSSRIFGELFHVIHTEFEAVVNDLQLFFRSSWNRFSEGQELPLPVKLLLANVCRILEFMFVIVLIVLQGPEQNAIGNLLVLALIVGLTLGVLSGWLWLIGRGW